MLQYVLPEEIFINVPHKMCGCPKSWITQGFFAVFTKWEVLEKVNISWFCKEIEGFIA